MTAQLRRTSLIEAATQACVGLPLGFVVSYAVSMLRLPPAATAVLITGLMFAVSVARGYLVRRGFEKRRSVRSYGETMEYVFKKECADERKRMG
jgi:hypothetical protein